MEYTKKTTRNMKSYIALGMSLEEIIENQIKPKDRPKSTGINQKIERIKQILYIYQELLHEIAKENGTDCKVDDKEMLELQIFLKLI